MKNILKFEQLFEAKKATASLKASIMELLEEINKNPKNPIYLEKVNKMVKDDKGNTLNLTSLKTGVSQAQIAKILSTDKTKVHPDNVYMALLELNKEDKIDYAKVKDIIRWSIKEEK